MQDLRRFYIDGQWVPAVGRPERTIVSPATEQPLGAVSLGTGADVEVAVAAARRAFETYSLSTREERLDLLQRLDDAYMARFEDIAQAISAEVGAPITLARGLQAQTGVIHIKTCTEILRSYRFFEDRGSTRIAREPVGVCGLITPWNWPINQICVKLIPALAAGCTVVLKPSEVTPACASILAEVMAAAGVPPGVFNLIHGDGPTVGEAIAAHPGIDMISFTGSTRAGIQVGRTAAGTVKRVALELGGKSPYLLLPDADVDAAVAACVDWIILNSGQSCSAPTRLLVPVQMMDRVTERAIALMSKAVIGDPADEATTMGPVVSKVQWDRVQRLIRSGIEQGANLALGGLGLPGGFKRGYFVRPTLFTGVCNDMLIAREEIFGPVLCVLPYSDEDEAVSIANDTNYGLAAYVASSDAERGRRIAARLRAGSVYFNGTGIDPLAPFGGYKQSGNGREWGVFGFEEYLETKAMLGLGVA
ncbi:MAG: aldehyde dehydrogenase family protein [Betaproteobacteria bacterium]|uniref:Aldehyde dehydrogenase family protein n=1 Tax=Candidatus Tanganyikabacteria bacterium TaxID=2961651 RepID=A0A937X4R5_9BACT|nr:aldehyde dehydrogenase family protein [Candidatus Tanganyikabacteria bacterium]MBM3344911.1 aldehyde dehydrogenase family protein [Betaproteobacteria bacterium]